MLLRQHALIRQVQIRGLSDALLVNDGVSAQSIEIGRVKPGISIRSQHAGSQPIDIQDDCRSTVGGWHRLLGWLTETGLMETLEQKAIPRGEP